VECRGHSGYNPSALITSPGARLYQISEKFFEEDLVTMETPDTTVAKETTEMQHEVVMTTTASQWETDVTDVVAAMGTAADMQSGVSMETTTSPESQTATAVAVETTEMVNTMTTTTAQPEAESAVDVESNELPNGDCCSD
jgi:membrane carboxypeptidase/penicillin-binding protein